MRELETDIRYVDVKRMQTCLLLQKALRGGGNRGTENVSCFLFPVVEITPAHEQSFSPFCLC